MPLSGAESVDQGHIYVLTLFSSDPGADAITSWEINWGDDDILRWTPKFGQVAKRESRS